MQNQAHQLGQYAEVLAARHLEQRGFVILARNYRYKRAEVDIIAKKEKLLLFVEVKARRHVSFGYPETFVSASKRVLLLKAAAHYIRSHNWQDAIRFDVIALQKRSNGSDQLDHFEDAFY